MDDPGCSWPAWKFGMKRDDLFSTLHDQYNTFSFTIQDPEAFHADVYEISHDAATTEEFHRRMADRRQQRLRELHESLETLAIEIIANPKLVDSPHWGYALQLFRTKSFDSLVRYFAAYLPDGYLDSRASSRSASFSDAESTCTASTKTSSVDDAASEASSHFKPFSHGAIFTEEPCVLEICGEEPLSPPVSETMLSEPLSAASPTDDRESRTFSTNPPSRSMSFSGSESDVFAPDFRRTILDDDDASQPDSLDTSVTSVSDSAERRSLHSEDGKKQVGEYSMDDEDEDDLLTAQFPEDAFEVLEDNDSAIDTGDDPIPSLEGAESDTPTPRQESVVNSYLDYKSVLCRRLPSPHRRSPSPKPHRFGGTPPREVRRSPDEAHSKIQKPIPESTRKRPKGRI